MRRRLASIRGRFLVAALVLVLACSVVNLMALGLFHRAVDRTSRRHLDEVMSLEQAIEILNLTTRVDELARVIMTDTAEAAVTTAYRDMRRDIAMTEQSLIGHGDGVQDVGLLPVLATINQIRQTATLVFSARIAVLRGDSARGLEVATEHRATLQAVAQRLIDHARAQVAGALVRTGRTANAIVVTSTQAMAAACLSIVLLLPAIFLGYRRLVARGLMARLEVIRDAMVADLSAAAPQAIPVRGRDEIAVMARALERLLDRGHEVHRARANLAIERRRLDAVVDNVEDGILVIDQAGRVIRANPAAQAMFGAGALPGLPLRELIDGLPPAAAGRQACEAVGLRGGRGSFPVAVVTTPLADDPLALRVVVIHDLTERRRVEEALRREAAIDGLTGQLNRRGFMVRAEQECARANRHGQALAMLMVDIDHFKRINDEHGHAVGDAVLVATAAAIRAEARETDIVGRLGGEEFAVLLPETDAAGAAIFAERLRRLVARRRDLPGGITVTISIGVASRTASDGVTTLLGRADAGLYLAKRAGRDRVAAGP